MKELQTETTWNIPVVYVCEYTKHSMFQAQINEMDLANQEIYNCPNLGLDLEHNGFPYYLLINRNNKIKFCYFPTKHHEAFDKSEILKICKDIQ